MRSDNLPSADIEMDGQVRWDSLDERQELLLRLGMFSRRAVKGEMFLFLKENNEYRILKKLIQLGRTNVYELSKSSRNTGHYSTILRALRRMERKGLVRVVLKSGSSERSQKVHEVTLLGELVESLASRGWKRTAEKIAAISPRFQDCQLAHQVFDSYYYWRQTHGIIESLMHLSALKSQQIDLERIVMDNERKWVKVNIIEKLDNPQTRAESLSHLEGLSNVDWIESIIVDYLGIYVGEWKKWLQTLNDFRKELASNASTRIA